VPTIKIVSFYSIHTENSPSLGSLWPPDVDETKGFVLSN